MATLQLKGGTFMGQTHHLRALEGFTLSVTEHRREMDVPNHAHEFPYISFLLHGEYHEATCVNEHDVLAGSALFRPQAYEHKNEIGDRQSLCFNLEIQKNIFQDGLQNIPNDYIQFERNNLEINKMYLGFRRGFSQELLQLQIEENLYLLFGRYQQQRKKTRALWVHKIKQQVRQYPEQKYTIDLVAGQLHLHPVYFVRKFKENTGLTFGEFLIRQRLSKSLDLMHHSPKTLTEIALESGFYDQSHFIRHFKSAFSVCPSEYLNIVAGK